MGVDTTGLQLQSPARHVFVDKFATLNTLQQIDPLSSLLCCYYYYYYYYLLQLGFHPVAAVLTSTNKNKNNTKQHKNTQTEHRKYKYMRKCK